MTKERTDRLRRRPNTIRYVYLVVTDENLHTGLSYGGLVYVKNRYKIKTLILMDIVSGKIVEVKEPVETFMEKWREHYNDPTWEYAKEVK